MQNNVIINIKQNMNQNCLSFCSKYSFYMKLTHIQVLIKKEGMKLYTVYFCCCFKSKVSVLSFGILLVWIFIQQNILEAITFL